MCYILPFTFIRHETVPTEPLRLSMFWKTMSYFFIITVIRIVALEFEYPVPCGARCVVRGGYGSE